MYVWKYIYRYLYIDCTCIFTCSMAGTGILPKMYSSWTYNLSYCVAGTAVATSIQPQLPACGVPCFHQTVPKGEQYCYVFLPFYIKNPLLCVGGGVSWEASAGKFGLACIISWNLKWFKPPKRAGWKVTLYVGCVRDIWLPTCKWLCVCRMRSAWKSWCWVGGGPGTRCPCCGVGECLCLGAWHSPAARAVPDAKHSSRFSFPDCWAF